MADLPYGDTKEVWREVYTVSNNIDKDRIQTPAIRNTLRTDSISCRD